LKVEFTFEYGTLLDPPEKVILVLLTEFVKPVLLGTLPGPVDLREESQHVRTQGIPLQTQNLKSGEGIVNQFLTFIILEHQNLLYLVQPRFESPYILTLKGKKVMTGKMQ
jgi:hypothetical protein